MSARPTPNARITARRRRDSEDRMEVFRRRSGKPLGRIFADEADQRPPVPVTVWNEMVYVA